MTNISLSSLISVVRPQRVQEAKRVPQIKFAPVQDTFERSGVENPKIEAEQNKTRTCTKPGQKENMQDDGILAYDGADTSNIREEMRFRILSGIGLEDEHLQVEVKDTSSEISNDCKFKNLYEIKGRGGNTVFVNLRETPDKNGVRGKTPLSSKNAVDWKVKKLKENGIKTVIDLRSEGECSVFAKNALEKYGLNYVNFPVSDKDWQEKSLYDITKFIKAVNEGDFYVGCANGESRTDLGMAINYLCNPEAENVPEFYFGSVSSSRVSVKENISQIKKLVDKNPEIVQEWGWSDYESFSAEFENRFKKVITSI